MYIVLIIFIIIVFLFIFWRFYFFLRDPKRTIPPGDDIVTSPADGYIIYVKRIEKGIVPICIKDKNKIPLTEFSAVKELKGKSGYLVGIFMTPFSVHRNRIPVSGEIIFKNHVEAPKNFSMGNMSTYVFLNIPPFEKDSDFLITNERLTIGIKARYNAVVTVTQIADVWVNRIIARINIGDRVEKGEQYGLIRFGSQVDVFIPDELSPEITVGLRKYVKAGETIIAKIK